MGKSYLKNAVLMTGADVLLRLAGMGLRIWLANALGGEGMGLYQLVLAVYSLFVTLATAGVSVAATRLMAEELARSPAEARGMLHRLLLAGAGLGVAALAAQFGLAGLAARWWLGDARAAGALRVSSLGLPWMAVISMRHRPTRSPESGTTMQLSVISVLQSEILSQNPMMRIKKKSAC